MAETLTVEKAKELISDLDERANAEPSAEANLLYCFLEQQQASLEAITMADARSNAAVNALRQQNAELRAELAAAQADRDASREGWWLAHGHLWHGGTAALYGDDGEMACNTCMLDFKRMTTDQITSRLRELAAARSARGPT